MLLLKVNGNRQSFALFTHPLTISQRKFISVHSKMARKVTVKPRPNDRNMSTQHIATLLGATCCVRLATMLRCVATCWVLLAQV